ncbi:hypothetical protein AC1031_004183 [Aphanomyces cochlioides]|nr:hypothetical protein AC1031_004183 [Aphanomyces cochlioides]
MLRVNCIVVGKGNPFTVDVDGEKTVEDLKNAIIDTSSQCRDATDLTLYRAVKYKVHLKLDSSLIKRLKDGEIPDEVKKLLVEDMDSTTRLNEALKLPIDSNEMHVLVVVGEEKPTKKMKPSTVPRAEWFPSDLIKIDAGEIDEYDWLAMLYSQTYENIEFDEEDVQIKDMHYFEMEFPVLMVNPGATKVFVRPCYEELFKLLMENIDKRVSNVGIKGTSGVGKSFFYAYCVFRLTLEPIVGRLLVINCADRFYVFEDNVFRFLSSDDEIELYRCNKNLIRLIDGQSTKLLSWSGVSILFSSPDSPGYKRFLSHNSVEYVMPPWTYQELKIGSQITDTNAEEADKRYDVFGGRASVVFSKTPLPDIDDVVGALSMMDTMRILGAGNMNDENMFPSIMHMFPKHEHNRPYRGVEMSFATKTVGSKAYDRMQDSCHGNLMRLLSK